MRTRAFLSWFSRWTPKTLARAFRSPSHWAKFALAGHGVAGLLGQAHLLFDLVDLVGVVLDLVDELALVLDEVALVVVAGEEPLLPAEDPPLP